jgi:hypothetical protein
VSALDEARRDAVARLCQAQAAGYISVGTFEDRYALVREATSVASLEALTADLLDEPVDLAALPPAQTSAFEPVPVEAAESLRIPAILGSAMRSGTWTVPEHIAVLVVLGEATLDFRDASFPNESVVVDLSVTFGSLKVVVPPGTQIENECHEVFSSSSHPRRGRNRVEPNGLLLILSGRVLFGEVKIQERPPSGAETSRFRPLIRKLLQRPDG